MISGEWNLTFGVLTALFLLTLHSPSGATQTTSISDVAGNIICTCGCSNMVLRSCQCGTADNMRSEIKELIDKGKTQDEIIGSYVERYGDWILAAPPKSGFNYTAWLTPVFGLISIAAILIFILRKWTANGYPELEHVDEIDSQSGFDDYGRRLDDELRRFG